MGSEIYVPKDFFTSLRVFDFLAIFLSNFRVNLYCITCIVDELLDVLSFIQYEIKNRNQFIFTSLYLFLVSLADSAPIGRYQKVFKKHKIPRESTDLEEYVFLVPKNTI